MVTDFLTLLGLCDDELRQREYGVIRYERLKAGWDELSVWMQRHNYTEFNQGIGYAYCDEALGGHLLQDGMGWRTRISLRAVRMLISYQEYGDFEFRSPRAEHDFSGPAGQAVLDYLKLCRDVLQLAAKTVETKERCLFHLIQYLSVMGCPLHDLNMDIIENFYKHKGYSLASRHVASGNVRCFLRFAFDTGRTEEDLSVYVPQDSYQKQRRLPTTYGEAEIREIIASVDRASAIGKRDYLILLLAAEYGWRSGDIVRFCFSHIDWDDNSIHFSQHKTGTPAEYPLLASVGNAVIDYVRHGRPVTEAPEIIVAAGTSRKGKPLSPQMVHAVVTQHMRRAGIRNWESKKHGAHSLRHSLATNMLKKDIPLPVISMVLGHTGTDATEAYLSVDIGKLRQCTLPMLPVHSIHYRKGGGI